MAKLHELIEGYDKMTDEERKAAIEAFDVPEAPDLSKYVKKELFDKGASEIAALKKQLAEKMTDEEAAKAAKEAADAERDNLIKELQRKNSISENEKLLLKQGYSAELANSLAEALTDGDTAKQLELMAKHDAEREKALRAEILRANPKPGGGGDGEEDDKSVTMAKAYGDRLAEKRKSGSEILAKYTK